MIRQSEAPCPAICSRATHTDLNRDRLHSRSQNVSRNEQNVSHEGQNAICKCKCTSLLFINATNVIVSVAQEIVLSFNPCLYFPPLSLFLFLNVSIFLIFLICKRPAECCSKHLREAQSLHFLKLMKDHGKCLADAQKTLYLTHNAPVLPHCAFCFSAPGFKRGYTF